MSFWTFVFLKLSFFNGTKNLKKHICTQFLKKHDDDDDDDDDNNNSSPRSNKQYALSSKEHQQIDSKCRMCYKAEENTKRIVLRCTTLAPSE